MAFSYQCSCHNRRTRRGLQFVTQQINTTAISNGHGQISLSVLEVKRHCVPWGCDRCLTTDAFRALVKWQLIGGSWSTARLNLSQCNLAHHKSHMDCPVVEAGHAMWEADELTSSSGCHSKQTGKGWLLWLDGTQSDICHNPKTDPGSNVNSTKKVTTERPGHTVEATTFLMA
jgi:hypothetical protein